MVFWSRSHGQPEEDGPDDVDGRQCLVLEEREAAVAGRELAARRKGAN